MDLQKIVNHLNQQFSSSLYELRSPCLILRFKGSTHGKSKVAAVSKRGRLTICGILLVLAGLMSGCITHHPQPESRPFNQSSGPNNSPDYIIHTGDQLDIKFFYNPELNESLTVRPDGKISLQLIDDVQATGKTPAQLDRELTEQYAFELRKPEVTVIVRTFSEMRIYVGGEVKNEGVINLVSGMTPLQAVFNAGGFQDTAAPESAFVIRKDSKNHPIPIRVNLKDALFGNGPGATIRLQPQDIIYVPKSFIAKANLFVNQYIEELFLFRGASMGFSYQVNRYSD